MPKESNAESAHAEYTDRLCAERERTVSQAFTNGYYNTLHIAYATTVLQRAAFLSNIENASEDVQGTTLQYCYSIFQI